VRLICICLGILLTVSGCESSVELQPNDPLKAKPLNDTLQTLARKSYVVPESITDRSKVQFYIGTVSIVPDLLFDGRLFFQAPKDSCDGIVRMYYDGELQDIGVESVNVKKRKGSAEPAFVVSGATPYPGELITIQIPRDLSLSKVNLFIDDKEILIDSIRAAESISGLEVIYFRQPESTQTKRVLRIDSAAYYVNSYAISTHTGGFLKEGALAQLSIKYWNIAGKTTIYHQADTGLIVHSDNVMSCDLLSNLFTGQTSWQGDTVNLDFTQRSTTVNEVVRLRLLPHPSFNYVSGFVEYERQKQNDTQRVRVELDKVYWRFEEGSYWLTSTQFAISSQIPKIEYILKYDQGQAVLEEYYGGGPTSTVAIGLHPKK
jgi:hypothetical protein